MTWNFCCWRQISRGKSNGPPKCVFSNVDKVSIATLSMVVGVLVNQKVAVTMPRIGKYRPKKSPHNQQGQRNDRIPAANCSQDSSRPTRSNEASIDYVEVDSDVDFSDEEKPVINMNKGIRIAICVLFEKDYKDLTNDVVEAIRRRMLLGKRHGVRGVLENYLLHRALGEPYNGERIQSDRSLGRKPILDVDSPEAQLLADNLEDGVSLPTCWGMINEHRRQELKPSVTYSAVYGLLKRMRPKQQVVRVHRQGSVDVDSPGAKARLGWAIQLLVRYGELDFSKPCPEGFEHIKGYFDGTVPLPSYYNKDKLTPLSPYQQVDFDEAHRQCTPGEGLGSLTKKYRLVFPRDANGKVDLSGQYTKHQLSSMKVKYNTEMRKCFGLATIKPLDSDGNELDPVGVRTKDFDYTCKNIKSIKEWKALESKEMKRVRELVGTGEWIKKNRLEGRVYLDDPVSVLPGLGEGTRAKFAKENILYVKQLLCLEKQAVADLGNRIPGLTIDKIQSFVEAARKRIIVMSAPPDIDYRKADLFSKVWE